VKAPQVRRAMPSSKTKTAHLIQIRHRDEVEAPITDWLQEAYEFSEIDARRFAGIVARKQAALDKPASKTRKVGTKKADRKIAKKR